MTKLEYSDFYKFLASLGIVLISLATVLPWLFLRESFDALVSIDDLSNLTSSAQTLIAIRQNTAVWFIRNIAWISSTVAVVGGLFLAIGLILWARKQRELDTRETLEKKKLELEIEAMTPAEIARKFIEEAQEDTGVVEADLAPEPLMPSSNLVTRYFRLESLIARKLSDCSRRYAFVFTHQRIQNSEYDIILRSKDAYAADVLIEVKLTRRRPTRQWLYRITDQFAAAVKLYKEETNRKAVGIILVISLGDVIDQALVDELRQFVIEQSRGEVITASFVPEEEVERLRCDDWDYILFPHRAIPK